MQILNTDFRNLTRDMPDKHYDLVFCDPPYNIGADKKAHQNGKAPKGRKNGFKPHLNTDWDSQTITAKQVQEIIRVSKHQVFFGANYYPQFLTPSMGWIFWDKVNYLSFSDGEMIYTSYAKKTKIIKYARGLESGLCTGKIKTQTNIHPTQKPIGLYLEILKHLQISTDAKILDTHLGSGSSAIACHKLGILDFTGTEINPEIYQRACKRIKNETKQLSIVWN